MSRTAAQAEVHCVRRRWRRLASSGPEPRSLTPHQVTVGLTDTCWHYLSSAQRFYRLARRLFGFASPRLASRLRTILPGRAAARLSTALTTWARAQTTLSLNLPSHSPLLTPHSPPLTPNPTPTLHSARLHCAKHHGPSHLQLVLRGAQKRYAPLPILQPRPVPQVRPLTRLGLGERSRAPPVCKHASKRGWHRGNGCGCRKGLPPGAPASVPAGSRTPRSHLLLQTRGEMPPFSPDPPAICVSRLL